MAQTPSTMLKLGQILPEFTLEDFDGVSISSRQFKSKPLLVIFMCNHCPYVQHYLSVLPDLIKKYQDLGVHVVAINSNDISAYPEDAPEHMKELSEEKDFTFPFLFDKTQEVAKGFRAACTPDFYLFDAGHKLVYRGQLDGSSPKNDEPVTGKDLTEAVHALMSGKHISDIQYPSIGCNIKWIAGNEPDYF